MSAYAQEDEKQPVAARGNVQFVPAASIAAVYPPAPNANAAGAGLRVNAGASPAQPADMRDVDLRRSNTGSLPPTRVGSPRVGGAGYEEDDDGFPISPPSQQPQQQQQQQQQRGGAGYVAPTRPGSASTVQRQPSNLGGYPASQQQQHQHQPQHPQHPHPQANTAASPSPTLQASHHSSLNLPPRAAMPGPETRAERLRLGIKSRHGPDAKGKTQSKFAACFGRAPPTPSAIWGLPLAGMLNPHTNGLPAFIEVSLNLLEHSVTSGTVSASALFQPKPCSEAQLQDLVNFLEENHESGEQLSEAAVGFYGCAAVGAFVLRWLDHLPEPLMTTERYHQFLTAANATPSDPAHPREIVAPGAGGAGGPGINRAFRSMFPFVAQANSSGGVSEDDQIFIMQSLLQSLHPAHYKLLQRMILLFRRMLQASMRGGGAASPGSALTSPSSAAAASLVGGVTNSTSVSLQRLAHLFSSIFLFPPASSLLEQRAAAIDYHRPQEQQVLIYLVQHYEALFLRHPVHLLHALPPPVAALDPNPALLEVLGKWRTQAGNLKVKFGRAQFDKNALTRAFRAWRGESKSNRRRAEAYRQLALLKQELLAERAKNAALSRELYGLREEFELRDFADSLRQQSHQIGTAYAPSRAAPPAAQRAFSVGRSPETNAGAKGSPSPYEEKESRPSGSSLFRASTLPGGARDLSADMAAVRSLQEQDRRLTATYGRINPAAAGMP